MQARLRTLAEFNAYLGSFPRPEQVMSAMVRGPLSIYGARSGVLMLATNPSELRMISHFGHVDAEVARYHRFPMELDPQVTKAFREQQVVIRDAQELATTIPAYCLDSELWQEMMRRNEIRQFVYAPIVSEGASLGTFTFTVPSTLPWSAVDDEFIHVISVSMGLWISNDRARLQESHLTIDFERDVPLAITKRQTQILTLVERGKSNDAIAATLGYSLSTVKAELRTICRMLRTNDRHDAAKRARELALIAA